MPKLKFGLPRPINRDPLIRQLIGLINRNKLNATEIASKAGLTENAIHVWARKSSPRIQNLEAALNVMGYKLAIKKIDDHSLDPCGFCDGQGYVVIERETSDNKKIDACWLCAERYK